MHEEGVEPHPDPNWIFYCKNVNGLKPEGRLKRLLRAINKAASDESRRGSTLMAVLILEHNLIDAEKHKIKQETPAATKKE